MPCYTDCDTEQPRDSTKTTDCLTLPDPSKCIDTLTTAQKELIRTALREAFRDSSSALCHQLRDRFIEELKAGHVMLGALGGYVNGWEDHYGFTEYSGRMHLDQALLDGMLAGDLTSWEGVSVMLHESMHTFKDSVTGKDLYTHPSPTSGLGYNASAHFPYPNTPFNQITETVNGVPPCVLR